MQRRYVLIPGAGGTAQYWYRVAPLLAATGLVVVPLDLPNWSGATLADQADAIVSAGTGADEVVLVAQSMGGFSAPLACDRLVVSHLFLVNAMIRHQVRLRGSGGPTPDTAKQSAASI